MKNLNNNQKKIIAGVVAVLVLIGVFYSGVKYAQGKTTGSNGSLSASQQARFAQGGFAGGTGAARGGARGAAGGGLAAGEVIAKDAKSLTIKLSDGGSKIVFISASSTVSKTSEATFADIAVGGQVTVTGNPNTDGSVTARSIQIRPAGMTTLGR